jgi:undecaprenyl pyrophosphate phosphatase UppP
MGFLRRREYNWIHSIIMAAVAATVGVITRKLIKETWIRVGLVVASFVITDYIIRLLKMSREN